MAHDIIDHDGMRVLRVSDMHRRFDPKTGEPLPVRQVNADIVHYTAIAEYYGLDPRDVWPLVHQQVMGPRVPYNTEDKQPGTRQIRRWKIITDKQTGQPLDTKEEIVETNVHWDGNKLTGVPIIDDQDDGMYVRLKDVERYAKAQGWRKGAGLPEKTGRTAASAGTEEKLDKLIEMMTLFIASQMQQKDVAPIAAAYDKAVAADKAPSLKKQAHNAWLAAGRPEPRDEFKANWIATNGG